MKIELKNIRYSEFASQETHCFMASVYIDGKRVGTVENYGRGACNNYHPHTIEAAIKAHAETLPATKWKLDGQELEIKQDADTLVGNLLVAHLYARDLKRALATRILFVNKDGILKETKAFTKDKLAAILLTPDLPKRLGSDTILNFMPFSLALQTYRETVAVEA